MKSLVLALVAVASLTLVGCGFIKNKGTNGTGDSVPNVTVGTNTVAKGDSIAVDYIGTLEDGTLFDTSIEEKAKAANKFNAARKYEPLRFTAGAGQMIVGFDEGVVGMKE